MDSAPCVISPAGVVEVPSDAPLKETLTPFAGENAVVLPAGFVPAHHAVHHAGLVLLHALGVAVPRPGRAALLLPPQVTLLAQSISAAVGVDPSPAHHGHLWSQEKPSRVKNSERIPLSCRQKSPTNQTEKYFAAKCHEVAL